MASKTDIANLALQYAGTRAVVTDYELANNTSNEAIQINNVYDIVRRRLLRMAPWNCGMKDSVLVYITSMPGTPENTSPAPSSWGRGLPAPPWAYEYQYPVDCISACYILPQAVSGNAGGVPLTSAFTGYSPPVTDASPLKFAIKTDTFRPVTAAAVSNGGSNHAVNDVITLPYGAAGTAPIGAPVKLRVTAVAAGVITAVSVETQVLGSTTPQGGSYFNVQTNPISQYTTTGVGTGASFNLTQGSLSPQRVILSNQQNPILTYVQDLTDVNVMDPSFVDAFSLALSTHIVMSLVGDKALANRLVEQLNRSITEARNDDGNEGLTINDVTPDWIRVRGIDFVDSVTTPFSGYNWGGLWPTFG